MRYYHRQQFLKEYTETISQGGLFIATDQPFEPGEELKIELVIPDLAAALPVTGRVAYRLDPQAAAELETKPGIGIQITEIDPRVNGTLRDYVQRIMSLYT